MLIRDRLDNTTCIAQSSLAVNMPYEPYTWVFTDRFSWECLYFVLFILCILFVFWTKEILKEYRSRIEYTEEEEMTRKKSMP